MSVTFRDAVRGDLPAVVALLQDDFLGSGREAADIAHYEAAFADMAREGTNVLIVGDEDGAVIACYQLTLISGISLSASRRAQIEGVRVASERRGGGVGALLIADAEARARAGGAVLLQMTANAQRERTHAFYERHGFVGSHIGFKKTL